MSTLWFDGTRRLLERMLAPASMYAYCVLGEASEGPQSATTAGFWINRLMVKDPHTSRAPGIAYAKIGELIWLDDPGISVTPVPTYAPSLRYKGGVRLGGQMVAVSKLAQEHDLLLAAVGLYAGMEPVKMHHVGFRYTEPRVFNMAINAATSRYGQGHGSPLTSLGRVMFESDDYYIEHLYSPDSSGPAPYWGLVTENADGMMDFLAAVTMTTPGEHTELNGQEVQTLWVKGDDGTELGVVISDTEWQVSS